MLLTQPVGGARKRLQIRFHPSDHSDLRAAWDRSGLLLLLAAWAPNLAAAADEHAPEDVETVEVIATTPLHGVGLPKDRVPAYVQTATGADLERLQSLDLSDFMN